jgi:transcriptional regulator with XRE-family HTH domain
MCPCSHGVVATTEEPRPEIATTPEWRAEMKAAREALGLTQTELGIRVGVSQNVISLIESGGIGASQFVIPISRLLKIHPPTFFESPEDQAWVQLGRTLRSRSPAVFRQALGMVEAMVAALDRSPE